MNSIKSKPTISVVMPVYNGAKYLSDAMDSVLEQTFSNFEFIIVNDGSNDNTEEIILSYDDPRIIYLKNDVNRQIVYSLNRGVEAASAPYIARMDADDISHRERFEVQLSFLRDNPSIEICGTWVRYFGATHEISTQPVTHAAIKAKLLHGVPFSHPTVMARAALFKSNPYKNEFNKAEDYALWMDIVDKYMCANIPKLLLMMRNHSERTDGALQKKPADKLKLDFLKRVGCVFNLDDQYRYLRLLHPGEGEIEDAVKYFSKIYLSNSKSGYVLPSELEKVLASRLAAILTYQSKYGFKRTVENFKSIRQSDFKVNVGFNRAFLIAKNLLKSNFNFFRRFSNSVMF